MSTNWKERWEEKDKDGYKVIDVATWSDGSPAFYRYGDKYGHEGCCSTVSNLIPRFPATVAVPWEPDEVPVGAVVRQIKSHTDKCGIISHRVRDLFFVDGHGYVNCNELKNNFVLHQPGVPTEQCQPCGKVVGK